MIKYIEFGLILLLMLVAAILSSSEKANALPKEVVGWVEKVEIYPGRVALRAKLDTGADNSSLGAKNIREFVRSGSSWVSFEVRDLSGKTTVFERRVVGLTKIKRHGRSARRRVVVRLKICLGNTLTETDVNLDDRSQFEYPLLIGRSIMAGDVVVDPSVVLQTKPSCVKSK